MWELGLVRRERGRPRCLTQLVEPLKNWTVRVSEMKFLGQESVVIGLVLFSIFLPAGAAVSGSDFVISVEKNAQEIAELAVNNSQNTCDLLKTCQGSQSCSRLECHPNSEKTDDNYKCLLISDTSSCRNTNKIRANLDRSYVRMPPFATLDETNSLSNNSRGPTICAQRELDWKFKEIYNSSSSGDSP